MKRNKYNIPVEIWEEMVNDRIEEDKDDIWNQISYCALLDAYNRDKSIEDLIQYWISVVLDRLLVIKYDLMNNYDWEYNINKEINHINLLHLLLSRQQLTDEN